MTAIPTVWPRFITLEGGEGVGKTTQLQCIEACLRATGQQVLVSREPGGTPFAESVRELLLAPRDEPVAAQAELLLMFAARAQHWSQKLLPALQSGAWVLCDRFIDASYAYQGGGRGLSWPMLDTLTEMVLAGHQPGMTLLLDVDPEVGLARAQARGDLDRFEQEQQSFFQRVRSAYLARAQAHPQRIHVVNAGQSLAQVSSEVTALMQAYINKVATYG